MLDDNSRKLLDEYCYETGMKFSDAIRKFINDNAVNYRMKKEIRFVGSVGENGLMINEKRAIRAAIESLFLLRNLVADEATLDDAVKKTDAILKQGWLYDSK